MKHVRYSLLALLSLVAGHAAAAEYVVDAARGNDSNPGTTAAPWRTLAKASATAVSGDRVMVRNGSYPTFSETAAPARRRTNFVTYAAAAGHFPRINGLNVDYPTATDAYLRFEGIDFFSSTRTVIARIENARRLQIVNSTVHGASWFIGSTGVFGIDIRSGRDITISGTRLHELHRGIQVRDSERTNLYGNYIQPSAGTAIQYLGGNTDGVIEGNHIVGAAYNPKEGPANPHASMISVRSSDLTIRGNNMHGMGSSSGVMFYEPDVAGGEAAYSNIVFENNAIYDVSNTYALRISNLGTNFVVRNNLLTSRLRTVSTGGCDGLIADHRYRYSTALTVESVAGSSAGLKLYNNIFIGTVNVPAGVDERNNIAWSWQEAGTWRATSASRTSRIITSTTDRRCGSHSRIFEDGSFFATPVDFRFPGEAALNWQLARNSLARNFGSSLHQPADSLGSIGRTNFLRFDDAPTRSRDVHSAGPVER